MKTVTWFLAAGVACILISQASLGATGTTAQGEPYVSGGTGVDERAMLDKERHNYNLWLRTATKEGAYVTDAAVTITTGSGESVLDMKLDGPWLLANLKPGEYQVAVTCAGKTTKQKAVLRRGAHTELIFRCDEPVETLPKGEKG